MLFMTPMKPANNLASSRAASFFSVFFLLLFSTPEAAILRQLGSRPGLAGPSGGLYAPGTLGLLFTKQRGRDCGCSALLPARPLRKDKAWRPPQKLTGRRRRGLGGVPTEPEPGRGVCALRSRGRARSEGSRGRGLRVTAARRSRRRGAGGLSLSPPAAGEILTSSGSKGVHALPFPQVRVYKFRLCGEIFFFLDTQAVSPVSVSTGGTRLMLSSLQHRRLANCRRSICIY